MRAFLGIVVGIVVGIALQSAADFVTSLLYPTSITNMWDRAQVADALAARPAAALWIGVAGYFIGGLGGGLVGKLVWRRAVAAWVPAGVLALMALILAFNYPIPTWTMFATFIASLLGGLLANHLIQPAAAAALVEGGDLVNNG
jgi:hypothetical protein